MAKEKLTAKQKLQKNQQLKKVELEKDFAGLKAGSMMVVATPKIVDAYIRKIAHGDTRTIVTMREDIAKRYKCEGTCPVSTSFFIRICCEAALEDINAGVDEAAVTPFWRLLTSKDKITARLPLPDKTWVDDKRAAEVAV